jgi:hypothetical protein
VFLTTLVLTWARGLVSALLACLGTRPAAALLTTPKVGLFTNNYFPQPTDATTAYTEPAFTGYAQQALTLTGPVNTGPGTQSYIGTVLFDMTGTGGGTAVVHGYWLSDGATAFYGAERFASPVNFVTTGDFLSLTVAFPVTEVQTANA